ncbi:MAG TPA: signal peptidase I [Thermoanaerobaculia bacterium]|nr:signal peptidase I [Thermoanaerobaculia bacterium]
MRSTLRLILQPLAIAIVLAMLVRAVVHIYSIPSASMEPTLQIGDTIAVIPYFRGEPARGDVIVFHALTGEELLVKRVIGTPGDFVDSHAGHVRVGGHEIAEPYVLRQGASELTQAQVVPSRCYYVLGDNRDDSSDSRTWGVVPRELVVGRARVVLWSSPLFGDPARATTLRRESERADGARARRLFKRIE